MFLGAGPGEAINSAMLAVAGEPARAAGIGAPIDDVHGAVGADDHLAGAEERIVALQELELLDDLERSAVAFDLVSADRLAKDVGVEEQTAIVFGKEGLVV